RSRCGGRRHRSFRRQHRGGDCYCTLFRGRGGNESAVLRAGSRGRGSAPGLLPSPSVRPHPGPCATPVLRSAGSCLLPPAPHPPPPPSLPRPPPLPPPPPPPSLPPPPAPPAPSAYLPPPAPARPHVPVRPGGLMLGAMPRWSRRRRPPTPRGKNPPPPRG